MVGHEAERMVQPLRVVRQVVLVKRPEILLVGAQIHHFPGVRIVVSLLERRQRVLQGHPIAAEVNLGEQQAVLRIVPGVMLVEIAHGGFRRLVLIEISDL